MSAALFARLIAQAATLAQRRARQLRSEIIEQVQSDFPDISLRVEDEGVVAEGRGLHRRWLRDARLRDALSVHGKGGGR